MVSARRWTSAASSWPRVAVLVDRRCGRDVRDGCGAPASRSPVPRPTQEVTRAFYRGLAALEVGLLDDARDQFARATELAPDEPASWANLALARAPARRRRSAPRRPSSARCSWRPTAPTSCCWRRGSSRPAAESTRASRSCAARSPPTPPTCARASRWSRSWNAAGQADAADEVPRLLDDLRRRARRRTWRVVVERARVAARRRRMRHARRDSRDAPGRRCPRAGREIALEQLAGLRQAVAAAQWTDAVALGGAAAQRAGARAGLRRRPRGRCARRRSSWRRRCHAVRGAGTSPRRPALAARYGVWRSRPSRWDARTPTRSVTLYSAETRRHASLRADATRSAAPSDAPADDAGVVAGRRGRPRRVVARLESRLPARPRPGRRRRRAAAAAGRGRPLHRPARRRAAVPRPVDVAGGVAGRRGDGRRPRPGGRRRRPARPPCSATTATAPGGRPRRLPPRPTRARSRGPTSTATPIRTPRSWMGSGALHVLAEPPGRRVHRRAAVVGPSASCGGADHRRPGRRRRVRGGALGRDGTLERGATRGARQVRPSRRWRLDAVPPTADRPARSSRRDLDNNGAMDCWPRTAARVARVAGGRRPALRSSTGGAIAGRVHRVRRPRLATARSICAGTAAVQAGAVGGHRARGLPLEGDSRPGAAERRRPADQLLRPRRRHRGPGRPAVAEAADRRTRLLHFGLGTATAIDVARVVWPNGVPQAEFGVALDGPLVAEQRLKGSCPWVFAHDGRAVAVRHRLPVAVAARACGSTRRTRRAWCRPRTGSGSRGDQLAPVDGAYDVRITAELWETHFFDHVSLLVVDHPADTEVFVDERFSAAQPPRAGRARRARRWHRCRARARRERPRRHGAGRRARRPVPGVLREGRVPGHRARSTSSSSTSRPAARRGRVLVAHGWIYPTDSSINMAIGQGTAVRPERRARSRRWSDGTWRVVDPDLGFPAGQEQDDGDRPGGRRRGHARLRLRTNLEVYWDWLAVGSGSPTRRGRRASRRRARRPALPRLLAHDVAARRRARDAGLRRASPACRSAGAISRATTRASATCASCWPASTIAT